VDAAIERGEDIVPTRTVVREWDEPRRVVDGQANSWVSPYSGCNNWPRLIATTTCSSAL